MERRGDLNGTERHLISSHLISRQKNEKEGMSREVGERF